MDNINGQVPGLGGQVITGMNKRNYEPLPKRKPSKFYHIYNISDHRMNPRIPVSWIRMGNILIWAREAGERYSKPILVPEFSYYYYDAGRPDGVHSNMLYREEDGQTIVNEILGINPPIQPDNDITKWGVFCAAGEVPTEAEIEAATKRMSETYQLAVLEADMMWEDPLNRKNISNMHRRAAKYLLQERPWCSVPKAMIACPGCGSPVNPIVAYHGGPNGCGAIVNLEAAKTLKRQEAELALDMATEPLAVSDQAEDGSSLRISRVQGLKKKSQE